MKAWIEHVPPEEATGALKELYDRSTAETGVDHILQIHSLVPAALDSLLVFYKRVMHGENALPYVEREVIAVTVSVLNRCHY
jgi:alkylhydroperoxidase family enzyme